MSRRAWAAVVAAAVAARGSGGEVPKHWGQPRFRGKRVLVTGGDSGIGLAAVQAFYMECAKVMMVGHSESKTTAAHAEVSALGAPAACAGSPPSVAWVTADISNETQVAAMMQRALQELGGLDIAVNNAGVAEDPASANASLIGSPGFVDPSGGLHDQRTLDVNLGGTLKSMNAEISHFVGAAA